MTEGNGDEGAGTAAPAEGAQALEERVAALVAEQTEGLRRKNSELLGEVKKLKGRSKDLPEDFDPEQWKALKDADKAVALLVQRGEARIFIPVPLG